MLTELYIQKSWEVINQIIYENQSKSSLSFTRSRTYGLETCPAYKFHVDWGKFSQSYIHCFEIGNADSEPQNATPLSSSFFEKIDWSVIH